MRTIGRIFEHKEADKETANKTKAPPQKQTKGKNSPKKTADTPDIDAEAAEEAENGSD